MGEILYRVSSAAGEISPDFAVRRLYRWINKVEYYTKGAYVFKRIQREVLFVVRDQVVLTQGDIQRFREVYRLYEEDKMELRLAILRCFSPEQYEKIQEKERNLR
ncbi:hypothetical protein [Enterococcus faecium]|uniref:Uncharacterized protein n=1 Tax=Enterococcus faecium TaxID=1352 RepID=A0A242B0E8_ENTFC|nr:hypothetical protein [Enterococcus faecium]OTN86625.1 hypothetical protein A5810_003023 [Enterococcus faecium]